MRALLVLLLVSVACRAEIIDRVAVVVGSGVITESEILREIRLTAFLNGEPLDSVRLRASTAWVDPTVQLWNRSLLANVVYGCEADATEIGKAPPPMRSGVPQSGNAITIQANAPLVWHI